MVVRPLLGTRLAAAFRTMAVALQLLFEEVQTKHLRQTLRSGEGQLNNLLDTSTKNPASCKAGHIRVTLSGLFRGVERWLCSRFAFRRISNATSSITHR